MRVSDQIITFSHNILEELEKLTVAELVKKFPAFIKSKLSLPCSQQRYIRPHPYVAYPLILSVWAIICYMYFPIYNYVCQIVSFLQSVGLISCAYFIRIVSAPPTSWSFMLSAKLHDNLVGSFKILLLFSSYVSFLKYLWISRYAT